MRWDELKAKCAHGTRAPLRQTAEGYWLYNNRTTEIDAFPAESP
jgi:hypothetical protein